MDVTAHQFFARSAFPIYKDAAVGRGNDRDLLAQRFGWNTLADDIEPFFQLMPEEVIRLFEPAVRQRVLSDQQRVFQRKRLFDKVEIGRASCRERVQRSM